MRKNLKKGENINAPDENIVKDVLRNIGRSHIVEQCMIPNEKGHVCERIYTENGEKLCRTYAKPEVWWERGHCPMATHNVLPEEGFVGKVRVGQQKQKKRR